MSRWQPLSGPESCQGQEGGTRPPGLSRELAVGSREAEPLHTCCSVPRYGMRYVAKVLMTALAEKFPDARESEIYKVSIVSPPTSSGVPPPLAMQMPVIPRLRQKTLLLEKTSL